MAETGCTRRDFLRTGGALAAGLLIAPGVFLMRTAGARPAGVPASSENRWGLLIDTRRCSDDCDACVVACREENGWGGSGRRPETDPQWIRKVRVRDPRSGRSVSLPVMCQHCASPPCVDVCPTGASMQRADGIVLVDRHRCIGCRYCMMACPYKARSLEHEDVHDQRPWAPRGKGTVESCTLCVHRIDAGREPACVEACRRNGNGALLFGDLADPGSAISRALKELGGEAIRADLGLDPGVRYVGLNL